MKNQHTLVFHIIRLAKKIQNLNSYKFLPENISYSQAGTLLIVSAQEKVNQAQISNKLHLKPASVVTLIDQLENSKLVKRKINPLNRRQYQIILTTKGENLAEKIKSQTQKLEDFLKNQLTKNEVQKLGGILEKLTNAIESPKTNPEIMLKGGEI